MRRVFKKCVAVALAAAMVVTLAPANADAAKKVKLSAKSKTLKVKKSFTLKVKNGSKKAKVSWKTSNKKVAALSKQVKKGNKASVKVTGKKKGSAKITATYKLGKKKTKLTCKVTVGKVPAPTAAPATTAPAVVPTTAPTTVPATATPVPTQKVTPTPRPTPTPSPRPKNKNLDAWQVSTGATYTIDGAVAVGEGWEDSKPNNLLTDITKESGLRGAEENFVTAANATFMWGGKDVYFLLDAAGDADKVILYYDENAKATKDTSTKIEIPLTGDATSSNANYTVEAKAVKADGKITVEAKITGKTDLAVDGSVSVDVQLCKGDATLNFYDTRSAMLYDAEKNEFYLGDAEVKVGENAELMGPVTLLPMMPPSTAAFYTDKGADILAASDMANKEFEPLEVAGADDAVVDENTEKGKTKKVDFIDPKFWTDCYAENGAESITFSKVNIPDWQGNAEKVGLAEKDAEGNWVTNSTYAQAYIMWDDNYVYVMFDVNDPDIAPAQALYDDQYMTDSTEFFLDECGTCTSYAADADAVQLRISAVDNRFSANSAGTGSYAEFGHAVAYKKADGTTTTEITDETTGYYTQYILKLNEKHNPNSFMKMDVQINDCYTDAGTPAEDNPDTPEDESAVAPTPISARAATLTAYDTTNTAYENPAVLERLKLIKKGVADEGGNGDAGNDDQGGNNDNPGNEGGNGDAGDNGNEGGDTPITEQKLDLSTIAIADGSTMVTNDDGSVTITCNGNYTGGITIAIPEIQVEGAAKLVVEVDSSVGGGQFNLAWAEGDPTTLYNWDANGYGDSTFDIAGKTPVSLTLNNQEAGNAFTIKAIKITK